MYYFYSSNIVTLKSSIYHSIIELFLNNIHFYINSHNFSHYNYNNLNFYMKYQNYIRFHLVKTTYKELYIARLKIFFLHPATNIHCEGETNYLTVGYVLRNIFRLHCLVSRTLSKFPVVLVPSSE